MAKRQANAAEQPAAISPLCKCTPEVIAQICAEIEAGNTDKYACATAGIAYETTREWAERGATGEEPFAAFAAARARARAARTQNLIKDMMATAACARGGEGDWKAQAWLIGKLDPDFADKATMELTGKDGGAVQVAAQVVLLPAPIHDADAWAKSVAADQAKIAGSKPD